MGGWTKPKGNSTSEKERRSGDLGSDKDKDAWGKTRHEANDKTPGFSMAFGAKACLSNRGPSDTLKRDGRAMEEPGRVCA